MLVCSLQLSQNPVQKEKAKPVKTCVFFSSSLVAYPDHQLLVMVHVTLVMLSDTPGITNKMHQDLNSKYSTATGE